MRHALLAACLLTPLTPAQPAPPQDMVEGDRLMATIRDLPAKRSAIGSPAHKEGLRATQTLLRERLAALGLTPTVHEFAWPSPAARMGEDEDAPPQNEPVTWQNILVDLPGTDLKHEVLLISGHFDAVPMGPGADDDGTGTAAILELARVLKNRPTRRTIRLALFNLEETGLVGSTAYAKSLRDGARAGAHPADPPGETIIGMASLEMLGYFSDEPDSQKSPIPPQPGVFEPPTVGDSICVVGIARDQTFIRRLVAEMRAAAPALKVTSVDFLPVPIPDVTRSDHRAFMAMKVPAVMVTDTANFRNPHYHQPTDTIDTIDAARYTLVVRAMAGAAYAIAEPAPPARP
jgi:Zn-dependent M28 family amino/carboxypeptidase